MRSPARERRLAVFCSGFGSNFQAILDAARRKRLKHVSVALMVCDNPKAYALKRAKKHKIPVFLFAPKKFDSREDYERLITGALKSQRVDLIALAGFMRILTPYFIRTWRNRILNIHPSLLPLFHGAHAIRDSYKAKVRQTGVTVHVVTEELDSGPIVLQKKIRVSPRDTLAGFERKIHALEHKVYPEAIGRYLLTSVWDSVNLSDQRR